MDQKSVVLYFTRKELSAIAIHHDIMVWPGGSELFIHGPLTS
jgi:hypothetical protein